MLPARARSGPRAGRRWRRVREAPQPGAEGLGAVVPVAKRIRAEAMGSFLKPLPRRPGDRTDNASGKTETGPS